MTVRISLQDYLPVVRIVSKKGKNYEIPHSITEYLPLSEGLQWVTHPVQLRSSTAYVTFFYRRDRTGIEYLVFHRNHKDYVVNVTGMTMLYYDVRDFFTAFGERNLEKLWWEFRPKRRTLKGRFLRHRIKDLSVHCTIKVITNLPYDIFDFLQNEKHGRNFVCIPSYLPVSTLSRFGMSAGPFSLLIALIYLNHDPSNVRLLMQQKVHFNTLKEELLTRSQISGILSLSL